MSYIHQHMLCGLEFTRESVDKIRRAEVDQRESCEHLNFAAFRMTEYDHPVLEDGRSWKHKYISRKPEIRKKLRISKAPTSLGTNVYGSLPHSLAIPISRKTRRKSRKFGKQQPHHVLRSFYEKTSRLGIHGAVGGGLPFGFRFIPFIPVQTRTERRRRGVWILCAL